MLNKVLKKMQEEQKKSGAASGPKEHQTDYTKINKSGMNNTGFHSKGNSEAGAYRQRSMGNRNTKPSKAK